MRPDSDILQVGVLRGLGGMMGWPARKSGSRAAMVVAVAVLAAASFLAVLTPAASARSADHGASFAVRCDFSHRSLDDPIVHFGEPGAAHSHDFLGNTTTDAYGDLLPIDKDPVPTLVAPHIPLTTQMIDGHPHTRHANTLHQTQEPRSPPINHQPRRASS